jgi:hypothetical protein
MARPLFQTKTGLQKPGNFSVFSSVGLKMADGSGEMSATLISDTVCILSSFPT